MDFKRFLSAVLAAATLLSMPQIGVLAEDTQSEENKLLVIEQIEGKEGNMFYDSESVKLQAGIKNASGKKMNISADYSVINYSGEQIEAGELGEFTLNAGETKEESFEFTGLPYDTYKLIINAESEAASESEYIEFSQLVSYKGEETSDAFGVCTHFAQRKGGDPNINLGIMQKTGTAWIRDDYSWGSIELEKGVYTFDFHDEFTDKAIANGLKVLAVITYGCKFYDEGNAPYTDEGIKAFAKYCGAVAEHYKGQIDHFEIWNEYNGGMGNPLNQPPEIYAKMLKEAYIEIKKANPDAVVVGCSTIMTDHGWIERVLKAGGVEYMDAVSVHPYSSPSSPEGAGLRENITKLHNMLAEYGKDMPVWYSEYGYPTYKNDVSEDEGAAYLERAYMIAQSINPDDKVIWYDFQNDTPPNDNDREANFGLIRHETNFYAAKQTLLAHANILNKLNGRKFTEFTQVNDNVVAYKFEGGESMLALWTLIDAENCSVKVDAEQVTITDFLGNEKNVYTQNGWITVPVSRYPIYIEGKIDNAEITASRVAQNYTIDIAAGESIEYTIERNAEDSSIEYTLKNTIPEGFKVSEASFGAGETSKKITIETVPGIENKTYQLEFSMIKDGKNLGEFILNVNVVTDRKVTITPVMLDTKNWDKWAVDIKIKNNSALADFSGNVTVLAPEEYAKKYRNMEFETLSYGEEAVIRIPIETAPDYNLIPFNINISYNDGREENIERKVSCLAAVKTDKPINLDGVYTEEEWGNAMEFAIADRSQLSPDDGEDDISGKGAIMWDKTHLYMGFVIKDDIQCQDQDGQGMWSADGLQIVVDPGRKNGTGSISWNELGFALKDNTTVGVWRWQSVPGKPGGKPLGIEANVVRDEEAKTTTYEISALWEELLPSGWTIDTGDLFGFSICANENDGNGRQGWIKYMGGIADIKDPYSFGDVILVDLNEEEEDDIPVYDDGYMWAHEAVHNLYKKNIIKDTVETYICGEALKAGDFAAALLKAAGETDCSWARATALGIATDDADENAVLSRQDMMVMLERGISAEHADINILNPFSDTISISEYAKQSIANLVNAGIIVGDSMNNLRPLDNANNAEAAIVLNKIIK